MSIQLTCPRGHSLKVADAWAGHTGRCPVCKAIVQVPALPKVIDAVDDPQVHVEASSPEEERRPKSPSAPTSTVSESVALTSPPTSPSPTLAPSTPIAGQPTALEAPKRVPDLSVEHSASLQTSQDRSAQATGATDVARAHVPTKITAAPTSRAPPPMQQASVTSVRTRDSASSDELSVLAAFDRAVIPAVREYDADKRWTVYYLAAAMVALGLFCMAPALSHWNLGSAPNWARAALLVSLLQIAYGAWAASIPDWSTLRSSMVVLTIVAALYGLTMTIALTTPLEFALPLDLTDVRRQAVLWCAGVTLLASLLAYFCGRAGWHWQRDWLRHNR